MDTCASSYRRYLSGDEAAFDQIVKELFDPLVFFIDRYVHDTAAAEDIAIDVFTELIVHKHRYNFKVQLKTYLFMIGRSRALNWLKHRNRQAEEPLEEAEHMDDRQMLEAQFLRTERARLLHKTMDALPEEMRTALHLVYFEDLSYEETAKVMKKTKKQVDNLLYRAKALLRTALSKEGELFL
jgi:RNA polymerase sigma-70 factor (ECF subfamily)